MAKKERSSKVDRSTDISKIRHSASHIVAEAILDLYPNTKLAFGPATDDGFYYDFEFTKPISEDNFGKIEKKINEILKQGRSFVQADKSVAEAKEWAKTAKQPYKVEQIDELSERGDKKLSFYSSLFRHAELDSLAGQAASKGKPLKPQVIEQSTLRGRQVHGDDAKFSDLCAGPHVEDSNEIGAIKLLSLAGAYWKGDEKNQQLTRIYGTAFATLAELDEYLEMLAEAKKRDHRKLGQELDLFTFSDLVGSGLPLFTPKGTLMRELIVEKIQNLQAGYGYQRVTIPHITKKDLYETSGHWEKFKDDLFHVHGKSEAEFVMKPMNCPHHTQIYASRPRSYRELPVRFMETTMVYRDEQQGELLGLARVRSISQDDGHVFCTIDQTEEETRNIVKVIKSFYSDLGLFEKGNYWVSLSVRDPKTPEKYLGDAKNWDKAERMLESVAKAEKLDYKRIEGEAAFYGPKLDFMFKDSLGRERQLGTAQIDFVMPARFNLEYTDKDGSAKHPVMIHRAIAGSLERFMAITIEHFAGAFPLWLSPEQVRILTVSEQANKYAHSVLEQLRAMGIRTELDVSSESIGKKIREAQMQKLPYMLILGEKEMKSKQVSVRPRTGEDLGAMNLESFIELLSKDGLK